MHARKLSPRRHGQTIGSRSPDGPRASSLVVVGDGWSALGLLGFLVSGGLAADRPVLWLSGTGTRMISPLPSLECGSDAEGEGSRGPDVWAALLRALKVDGGTLQRGSFLREFRNKGFRAPAWERAPSPEARRTVRDEALWAPERTIAPLFEARFGLSLGELETRVRERLGEEAALAGKLRRVEGIPLASIQVTPEGRLESLRLGNGEEIACDRLFYADRWGAIPWIEGFPKGLSFVRGREPVGVLQAVFTHEIPLGTGLQEGFFSDLNKEAGEEIERHVWGYFSSDGTKSFWTLCFSPEEAEDNHAIARKLRKLKGSLEKMFPTTPWLPEGKPDFMSNVKAEQVRFEESALYSKGDAPREPVGIAGIGGIRFLTDGYGPSSALEQVGVALEAEGMIPALSPGFLPTGIAGIAGIEGQQRSDPEAVRPDSPDTHAS